VKFFSKTNALITASAVAFALVIGGAPLSASASGSFQIAWTKIGIYPRTGPSMSSARSGSALSDGTWVTVACELTGDYVTSDVATTNIWERLTNGTFLPNAFVNTHVNGWTPGIPRCDSPPPAPPAPPAQKFKRADAASWASKHLNDAYKFNNDCTWFVSNALWAGGLPKTSGWTSKSYNVFDQASGKMYPGPSKAAAAADYFKNAILTASYGNIKELSWDTASANSAQVGDVIAYDWNGGADGAVDHVSIVTKVSNGVVYVTQHSPRRLDRQWNWDPSKNKRIDKTADGTGARVYLIHITW
jgi:hypothetical protein